MSIYRNWFDSGGPPGALLGGNPRGTFRGTPGDTAGGLRATLLAFPDALHATDAEPLRVIQAPGAALLIKTALLNILPPMGVSCLVPSCCVCASPLHNHITPQYSPHSDKKKQRVTLKQNRTPVDINDTSQIVAHERISTTGRFDSKIA